MNNILKMPGAESFMPNPTRKYDPEIDGGEQCILCHQDFSESDGRQIVELNCGHIFHENCFKDWIQAYSSQECPSCQAPIKHENTEFDL
jgi:hypothetical protein